MDIKGKCLNACDFRHLVLLTHRTGSRHGIRALDGALQQGESRADGMTSELWRAARLVESALDAAVASSNVAALIVSNDMPSAALVAAASVCRRSVFFVLVPSVREAVRHFVFSFCYLCCFRSLWLFFL